MSFYVVFNESTGRVRQLHSGEGEIGGLILEGEAALELDLQLYTQLMEAARTGSTLSVKDGVPQISPRLQLLGLPPITQQRNGLEIREVKVPSFIILSGWESKLDLFINMEKVQAEAPFQVIFPTPGAYRISVDDPVWAQETWVIHGVS